MADPTNTPGIDPEDPRQWAPGLVVKLALATEGGLALVALVLGWLSGRPPLALVRLDLAGLWIGIAATIPLIIALRWTIRSNAPTWARLRDVAETVVVPLFARCTVADLAIISVAAGIGEELLFRGLMHSVFAGWWGAAAALGATSMIFGLAHLVTPTYALVAGVMGLYLGSLSLAAGNLLPAIVAHALYDFVALMYLVKRRNDPLNSD